MKIIDLTHDIKEGMPVYPGTEAPQIKIATTIENDGFEERLLTMFSHTGTHMDAPSHILKGKKCLSDFDISDFAGSAVLVDVRDVEEISAELILKYSNQLEKADFAVLFSGWDKHWGSSEYFVNYPVMTTEAVKALLSYSLKGVCMDMISIDRADTETYRNHKMVFDSNLLVVENLKDLHLIPSKEFHISCMPIRIKGGDGAPVRAFASLDLLG